MMPLCSKFFIKWWLTCFWGLYLYYYYYYSFCELVWTWLMAIFFTSTRKWTLAMLFSTGRNLGFTCLGMRLVNMCLNPKMLYTRSTTTMTIHLEISMSMLEQQLPPLIWSQLNCGESIPLRVVRVVLARMWWLLVCWWWCLDFRWGFPWTANATAILRPMMTQLDGRCSWITQLYDDLIMVSEAY